MNLLLQLGAEAAVFQHEAGIGKKRDRRDKNGHTD